MTASTNPETTTPAQRYHARIQAEQEVIARAERQERLLSGSRLAVLVLGLLLLAAVVFSGVYAATLLLPVTVFFGLVIAHERVIQARDRGRRLVDHFERGLARLEGGWIGLGEFGLSHLEASHAYAEDLDLFGRGSLFEYLSTARTEAGEATLAQWLQHPADAETIRSRQEAVAEVRDRPELREELALLGETLRAKLHPQQLETWAGGEKLRFHPLVRWMARAFNLLFVSTLIAWGAFGASPLYAVLALLTQTAFVLPLRGKVGHIIATSALGRRDLDLLSSMLARIEQENFSAPHLQRLLDKLKTEGLPAAARISQLGRLVGALDARRNQVFAPFAYALLFSTQIALRIEDWRVHHGRAVRGWLGAVGEFEALASLAAFAWEHRGYPFPEIDADQGPTFCATKLGHPLIPTLDCVPNDLRLGPDRRLLVISGSNMSGKSTMLRSVGVNAVLALAGAPVCAESLALSVLTLGASIRVSDSLQDGASRFYTEIRRLRQIFDLLGEGRDLLFLLDELLQGTNSHDRLIGAEAVVGGLLERGGIGLLTTHDLALTEMTARLPGPAENIHFEDQMVGDEILFDYRCRPGIVQHSNALALMRAVGLEV